MVLATRKSINNTIEQYIHRLGLPVAVFVCLDTFLLPEDKERLESKFELGQHFGSDSASDKLVLFIDYFYIDSTSRQRGINPRTSLNLLTNTQTQNTKNTTMDTFPRDKNKINRKSKLEAGCLVSPDYRSMFERCVWFISSQLKRKRLLTGDLIPGLVLFVISSIRCIS